MAPKSGFICKIIIITPIPHINPEIIGYGINFIHLPKSTIPKDIWIIPAKNTTAITVEKSFGKVATAAAVTTVIGPVGPETWTATPPKRAAIKPNIIAP